jgi:hypothetical protein
MLQHLIKDICSTMFIEAIFIIARSWKQPRCPSRNGNRKCGTFTQWSTTQTLKKKKTKKKQKKNNDFMKFAGKWMELENILLSEVTQSQMNKLSIYSLILEY